MSAAISETSAYPALLAMALDRAGAQPEFFRELRQRAAESFVERGFPSPEDEQWRYTNVTPLSRVEFELPELSGGESVERILIPARIEGVAAELVFVDGFYVPSLSRTDPTTGTLSVTPFSQADPAQSAVLERDLGRHAALTGDPFVALNTALLGDGVVIEAKPGAREPRAVHVIFASTGTRRTITAPRVLIVAGAGSQLEVIESFVGSGSASYFTCAVTEILAGENAVVRHCKVQNESSTASHIALTAVQQERNSSVDSFAILVGGELVRNGISMFLSGEGSSGSLSGLYVMDGKQHCDNHLLVVHAKPHTTSHQFFKSILSGASRGIFDGKIIVKPDAQKIAAAQVNRNLLLSSHAVADSKPQLEIYADDVKCSHGSTIGQLDEDQLFYIRARGIDHAVARQMLTAGFAGEVVERIAFEPLRRHVERLVGTRLSAPRMESVTS